MRKWKLNKITDPLFSIVLVLLIGVVIMLVVGYDPIYAYGQLIRGGFGTKLNFGTTLEKITPVLLSGLAFVIGMKGDFFNMGVEGQMTLAAITTAWLGVELFGKMPAALVVIAEHVGHLVVTANIVKRDLIRDPGLHRSMFANGLSTIVSGFFGSTPNTTYGENIGVMAITRVYSTWVIGGAAIIAILLSCVGKLAAAIQIIPVPVMGGVSLLLYGVIGASGIRVLIESKVDYSKAQNLILTSVILIIGVSGAKVHIGAAELKGMALATIVGIALSLIFKLISVLRPEEVVLDAADSEEFK